MSNSKFHHEEIYRGKDLVQKLKAKKIIVCGGGAIGSNLIDNLVRQGVSSLRVIDKDRVETHNVNTQTFDESDVGAMKANVIQAKAYRSVGADIEIESKELTAANIKKLLKGGDLIVDAFDNSASRKLLQEYCRAQKIPLVHAGLSDTYSEVVWDQNYKVPSDSKEDVCDNPMARNLILMTVAVLSEEIINFCLEKTPRYWDRGVTLKDLKISPYK